MTHAASADDYRPADSTRPADDDTYPTDDTCTAPVRSLRRPPGELVPDDRAALEHLVGLVGDDVDRESLWVTFVSADNRSLELVLPVHDLPAVPDAETPTMVAAAMREVVREFCPGAHALVALVRPDGGDYGDHECRWAEALWRAGEEAGWSIRMIAAVGIARARVLDRTRCAQRASRR